MRRPVIKKSTAKHSVVIDNHKSSISLEPEFWEEFKEIAARQEIALAGLAAMVDRERKVKQNLSSAIRCYILADAIKRARESEQRAIDSEAIAAALDRTVKSLVEARDRAANTRSGLAPITTVIAAGRANG